MNQKKYHFETLQLHAGQEQPDSATRRPCSTDLCVHFVCVQEMARKPTARFRSIRTRLYLLPTWQSNHSGFRITGGLLEGGIGALATASGAGGKLLFAIQNLARLGDHIVSAQSIYGGHL